MKYAFVGLSVFIAYQMFKSMKTKYGKSMNGQYETNNVFSQEKDGFGFIGKM